MPVHAQPSPNTVLMCDFNGYIDPEINKKRPVVIVSRHPHNRRLVSIVPLSTTQPTILSDYHHEIISPLNHTQCWAKCDLIYTISIDRLDRCKVIENGEKQWTAKLSLNEDDYNKIRQSVAKYLGMKL